MIYAGYRNNPRGDEQYTPQYAVLPILKYLPKKKIIWCPFDTAHSEFVIALKEAGFKVIHSHIGTGQDFFEYEPTEWDIIVSNPPFSIKKQILERCLSFNKPFALLLTNLWLNSSALVGCLRKSKCKFYYLTNGYNSLKKTVCISIQAISVIKYSTKQIILRNYVILNICKVGCMKIWKS